MTTKAAMTGRYASVLALLALLSLASYVLLRQNIKTQNHDAAFVNISGRQRMLSQRTAMFSLRLAATTDRREREDIRRQLHETLRLMERSHELLLGGDKDLSRALSPQLQAIYFSAPVALDAQVREFIAEARSFALLPDSRIRSSDPRIRYVLAAAGGGLLQALDAAVSQFQAESEGRVSRLDTIALGIMAGSLLLLAAAGLFIFEPMVRAVMEEREALRSLNETLEQRVASRSRELSRLRDSFIHNVNHELRTPIACVKAALQTFMEAPAKTRGQEQDLLDIALRNTERINSLIDDLLEATRAQTGKLTISPRPTSIPELIKERVDSLQLVARAKGIELVDRSEKELPAAFVDASRVAQILTNLISNAIKFTPSGGVIAVAAQVYAEDPDFLLLSVSDTGHGIRAEALNDIFERLYQVADSAEPGHKGLGLGLYICRELVSQHHGKIWVTSQVGKGSVFSFTLPTFVPPS